MSRAALGARPWPAEAEGVVVAALARPVPSAYYGSIAASTLSGDYEVMRGVLVADGRGGANATDVVINREGNRPQGISTQPYFAAVNARGEFTLQYGSLQTLQGGISPNGRYAVLGGSAQDDGLAEFWILVRL